MICVLNDKGIITNILDSPYLGKPNTVPRYEWNNLWEQYTDVEPIEHLKTRMLNELNTAHEKAESEAYVVSSLGFTIDADNRANRDIDGILKTIGNGTVMFCDYENEFHELNRAQCETLQVEIIQNAQALYAQKWAYRAQVEGAESVDELNAIEFTFSHLSF